MKQELISKQDAALIMGVSVRSVERLISRGMLEKIKILGAVRIKLSDVKKLIGEEVSA